MHHQLEWIEARALADLNRALAGRAVTLGRVSRAVGTAYLSGFAALPASAIVVNRTIGLGLDGAVADSVLDKVTGIYAEAGIERYFVHVHPDAEPQDLGDRLKARGLGPARAWVKFSRGRELPPPAPTRLELRRAERDDAPALGRIAAAAFDLGAVGAEVFASLVGRNGWHIFMSTYDGEPAGCGALYVENDIGWLDWGATDPRFRGLNGQTALLRRRIIEALDRDCRLLATCTGEEVPGEPQISWRNITKLGFTMAYTRRNYAPPKRA